MHTDACYSTAPTWIDAKVRAVSVALLVIMGISLGLSIFFYTGYYNGDDRSYLYSVKAIVGEEALTRGDFGALRLGVTGPAALAYWLFGGSVTAAVCVFLLYPPLLTLVAYWIGFRAYGAAVGLLAAFLTAASPILYVYAGAMLPDNPLALWWSLALVAMLNLLLDTYSPAPSRVRQAAWAGVAGVCLGLAYLVKETGLIGVVPLTAGLLLCDRTMSWRRMLGCGGLLLLAVVVVVAAEAVLLRHLTGHWVLRLGASQTPQIEGLLRERMVQHGATFTTRLTWLRLQLQPLFGSALVPALLAVLACPLLSGRKKGNQRAGWLLVIAALWPALYLTYGSATVRHWVFPPIWGRYYAPCLIPAAVAEP